MTQIQKAILLASVVIGVALFAVAGIIPERVAQWAPLVLLAIFPSAWMSQRRKCGAQQ